MKGFIKNITGGGTFKKDKCAAYLRQGVTRMNIHRQKKLNHIAKVKDDICTHLKAGSEVNALIWCETLINDERFAVCFDVVATLCDQMKGRLEYLEKKGVPLDMQTTLGTLSHVAPKMDIEELMGVRK
mmetsp:Transcript_3705/g.6318  ORF Transcript_3705/g.6318 Transcript_3705/m.6318 type:complete len:128 (+) Transcript_3705:36-419(+)